MERPESQWVRENLVVGREFQGDALNRFRVELLESPLPGTNIDDEPFTEAILRLVEAAESSGGRLFVE